MNRVSILKVGLGALVIGVMIIGAPTSVFASTSISELPSVKIVAGPSPWNKLKTYGDPHGNCNNSNKVREDTCVIVSAAKKFGGDVISGIKTGLKNQ